MRHGFYWGLGFQLSRVAAWLVWVAIVFGTVLACSGFWHLVNQGTRTTADVERVEPQRPHDGDNHPCVLRCVDAIQTLHGGGL